jgi:CxxC motif-containing protein (DUF1111 family)
MHKYFPALLVITLFAGLGLADDAPVRTDLSPEDLERVRAITAPTEDFSKPEQFEALPAGAATTTKLVNRDSFSHSSANLTFEQEGDFKLGNALFRKVWVSAPSSTLASDGLGPLFNARGCQNCHLKDGRGHPPEMPEENAVSMFLRLSVPPQDAEQQTLLDSRGVLLFPEPTYGEQLQVFAVPGLPAEGRMVIDYAEVPVTLGDGTVVSLRQPAYSVADLAYGPMSEHVMLSPRVAPQMIGLGLLEAIPAEDILALADPDDADGDGISGKPNWVTDIEDGAMKLGRFGWKAGAPSIRVQSASAFAGDIGISTPLVNRPYGDCTPAQVACLADHRPEGAADGYEWRTPPLWGIGLTETVSDHTLFLHDGRARNLTEAILWHGGEAAASRDAFANLPESSRNDLLAFLESL